MIKRYNIQYVNTQGVVDETKLIFEKQDVLGESHKHLFIYESRDNYRNTDENDLKLVYQSHITESEFSSINERTAYRFHDWYINESYSPFQINHIEDVIN